MPFVSFRQLLSVAACGLLVGLLGFLFGSFGNQILFSLTPQPEPLTELYFADHLRLPIRTEFDTPVKVPFTIHNLEYKEMQYTVQVLVQFDGVYPLEFMASEEKVTLQHDEVQTLLSEVSLPAIYAKRAKVTILLKELDQSIHYWIDVPYLMPVVSTSPSPTVESPKIFPE